MALTDASPAHGWRAHAPRRLSPPLFPLQPLLACIVRRVARRHPEMFARLGPHRAKRFLIDPVDLPFALFLRPSPDAPVLRACPRGPAPAHDARIAAPFLQLLRMIDCAEDGDAMFFSRELSITGDTEAVVALRNAIDNIDGSLAADVAAMFGPPGRAALALMRRAAQRRAQ
jgi:O2-independent ubiquinone biosynthesis accessory factor UbiT